MNKIEIATELIKIVEDWKAAVLLKRSVAEKNATLYALAQGDPVKEKEALHKLLISRTEFYSASEIDYMVQTIENKILLQDDELHKLYKETKKLTCSPVNKQTQ